MVKPRHDRTRPVPWMDLFWATRGWLAVIAGAAMLGFTLISVAQYRLAHQFATQGVWSTAEITAMRISRNDDNTDYDVTFRYDAEGRKFRSVRDTGKTYYEAHSVGDTVEIKYLPARPSRFEYREGQTHQGAKVMQITAGVAGVLGCGLLWWSGSKANRAILARRRGRRTVAQIDSFVEHRNKGRTTGKGYMTFHTSDGQRGKSLTNDIETLRELGQLSEIVVYVRGKDVWWEGDVGPRADRPTPIPDVDPDA